MLIERIDPRTSARYAEERELRYRVLRAPLGMGRDQVGFAGEEDALHWIALEDELLIGCVLFDFASGRLRAMAVLPSHQKRGIGRQLVSRLEIAVKAAGIDVVSLHARDLAVGFYTRLGYSVIGEPFEEVGIQHFTMRKQM